MRKKYEFKLVSLRLLSKIDGKKAAMIEEINY
jgi:hypothetical protein